MIETAVNFISPPIICLYIFHCSCRVLCWLLKQIRSRHKNSLEPDMQDGGVVKATTRSHDPCHIDHLSGPREKNDKRQQRPATRKTQAHSLPNNISDRWFGRIKRKGIRTRSGNTSELFVASFFYAVIDGFLVIVLSLCYKWVSQVYTQRIIRAI